jgi:hypothetical protein
MQHPKGLLKPFKLSTYKHSYSIENFSLDIFQKAIEDYMKDKPRSTYEQELAWKLAQVRAQIEDVDTWMYKPELRLEDLKDGDMVYILTSWGWTNREWPGVLNEDTHTNLWGGDTIESKFNYATLRKRRKT